MSLKNVLKLAMDDLRQCTGDVERIQHKLESMPSKQLPEGALGVNSTNQHLALVMADLVNSNLNSLVQADKALQMAEPKRGALIDVIDLLMELKVTTDRFAVWAAAVQAALEKPTA